MTQDLRKIDPALRAKYDVRGPRYTSYPPATHFKSIDTLELFDRWRERNEMTGDPGLSLYLHIPYCRSRCLFCGCHTFVGAKPEAVNSYVDSMIAEMKLAAGLVNPNRPVHQLALGGGTPNFLSVSQVNRLLDELFETWNLHKDAERSVEIDPRTISPEKLDGYLDHGFNRFSLGIQDFSPEVLRVVRRGQDLMQVEEVVAYLTRHRIESINFDLIYGLPGQSLDSAATTTDKVLALKPTRIALYSYAHVPWMFAHQQALERQGLPEPDLKAAIFKDMQDRLLDAGYRHIGMDHFSLPDDPLALALDNRSLRRNFMGYTTGRGLDLLAFGASAISSVGSAYSQNEKQLQPYQAGIQDGKLPIMRGFLLSPDDLIRRELLLELFCNFYADLGALSKNFGIDAAAYLRDDLERLKPLRGDGLVDWTETAIQVSELGRFFIRNICMIFDRYLEPDGGKRVYSRTV